MTAQRPAIGSRKFLKIVFLSLDWNEIKQKLKLKTSGGSLRVIFRVEGKPCKKVASEELGFVRQLHARRHFHHLTSSLQCQCYCCCCYTIVNSTGGSASKDWCGENQVLYDGTITSSQSSVDAIDS